MLEVFRRWPEPGFADTTLLCGSTLTGVEMRPPRRPSGLNNSSNQ
jgi:hypothetical protein